MIVDLKMFINFKKVHTLKKIFTSLKKFLTNLESIHKFETIVHEFEKLFMGLKMFVN